MSETFKRALFGVAVIPVMIGAAPAASGKRSVLLRNAESYAIASCLIQQRPDYLKTQGDGWAANIVQREAFDLEAFKKISAAVKSQVNRGDMSMIIVENPPMTSLLLPVQYCVELVDQPIVRRAIDKAVVESRRAGRR